MYINFSANAGALQLSDYEIKTSSSKRGSIWGWEGSGWGRRVVTL